MIRFVHFSDIHVFQADAAWKPRDYLTKRLTGFFNQKYLPRGKQFREAVEVLKRLVDDLYSRKPDMILFSGDATTLGVEEEFAIAAEVLRVGAKDAPPGLAVPGNHDYYTRHSYEAGLFEKYFAPWLQGDRVDQHTYPYGRQAGPFYILGVNSSQPRRWWWDSSGMVGLPQLERLKRLLQKPEAMASPKILLTHYPIALSDGKPERRHRRLKDLAALLEVIREHRVGLWLHGHRHKPYHVKPEEHQPMHALCVGSGTQESLWTYAEYTFDGKKLHIEHRAYQPHPKRFEKVNNIILPHEIH